MPSVCAPLLLLLSGVAASPEISWSGDGKVRVLISVAAEPTASGQTSNGSAARVDERPADVRIEFERLLAEQGSKDQVPDPASIQVIRHDAQTGEPIKSPPFAFGRGEFEIRSRWYDATIPYEFPECNVNRSDYLLRPMELAHRWS